MSKTRPASDIRRAFSCGLSHFGENYLAEAMEKMAELEDLDLTWHYIGPIQSNKTRGIARNFDWVHSIDRDKTARRISEQRPQELPPMEVCIQVNISGEASKSGTSLAQLPQLARCVIELPRLRLRGLMGIPAPGSGRARQREDFARLRGALDELRPLAPHLDTLSMGMSSDLDIAIEEGATIVRVGTAIFGPRNG